MRVKSLIIVLCFCIALAGCSFDSESINTAETDHGTSEAIQDISTVEIDKLSEWDSPLYSFFSGLTMTMSVQDLKSLANQSGLELGGVADGLSTIHNEYYIGASEYSRSSMPTPISEKDTYIYLVCNDGGNLERAYLFDIDKMVLLHFYCTPYNGMEPGCYVEDYAEWKRMVLSEDGNENLLHMNSFSDALGYTPTNRDPVSEPLIQMYCSLAKCSEQEFLDLIELNNLMISHDGVIKTTGGHYYIVRYSARDGSSLTVTFTPDGTVVDGVYEDYLSSIRTKSNATYSMDTGFRYEYYVSESSLSKQVVTTDSGEEAIQKLLYS